MFNLSSWQNEQQSITDWLLSELKLKYGVSQQAGQNLAQRDKLLLPLLDGLDELPPQRQEPVVAGINDWLQSGAGAESAPGLQPHSRSTSCMQPSWL
jgi:predicted NACHT family NTPase